MVLWGFGEYKTFLKEVLIPGLGGGL